MVARVATSYNQNNQIMWVWGNSSKHSNTFLFIYAWKYNTFSLVSVYLLACASDGLQYIKEIL